MSSVSFGTNFSRLFLGLCTVWMNSVWFRVFFFNLFSVLTESRQQYSFTSRAVEGSLAPLLRIAQG